MSTRKRNNNSSSNVAPKSDLPSSRKGKATAKSKTNLPFSRVSFRTFIYTMSALALVFVAFQAWRIVQLKSAAGGWWNLALGRRPPPVAGANGGHAHNPTKAAKKGSAGNQERDSVEDRINELAKALGLPSRDLASAIAEAVRSHIPPASLSSIAAAEATKGGTLVGILTGEEEEQAPGTGMADKLGAVAGFDDPVDLD